MGEDRGGTFLDATFKRIALIAGGSLGLEGASQFLNATFGAEDYLEALHNYPKPQQYIDSLYEVCNYTYPRQRRFDPYPARFSSMAPLTRQRADAVSGLSGRPEQ